MSEQPYDSILVLSFGGPEKMEDVMPFLRNVTRGRGIPDERLQQVAHHYEMFDGVSPINEQNRQLIKALRAELLQHGIDLPIYWGNRNWHPMLEATMAQMVEDGKHRAIAFATSAYSSYSSCRQYLEDIDRARTAIGPSAPEVEKVRAFFNHPLFVETNSSRLAEALEKLAPEERESAYVVFTAHSIPIAMSAGCSYAQQLEETARLVVAASGIASTRWQLAYQSRSGPPSQPWLEPDICDVIKSLSAAGHKHIVISPIGFISDHMEVIYDLDVEAKQLADELGVKLVRATTAGTHPKFIGMVRQLIEERLSEKSPVAVGAMAACPSVCPPACCPSGRVAAAPPAHAT